MKLVKKKYRGATVIQRNRKPFWSQYQVWHQRFRWIGLLLLLLLASYTAKFISEQLSDPRNFPLRRVHIEGELHNLSESDFQPVVGYLGQNFFFANLDRLNAVLSANPWVETVSVQRWWPDTIEIKLQERKVFGYWGANEMVDINGIRFRPHVIRQQDRWPYLFGPNGHEELLINSYQLVSKLLNPLNLKLKRLIQDERRAWWLTFENGLEVYLGREQFQQRLQKLAKVYNKLLAPRLNEIAIIDMRYVNGFAVRWKLGQPAPTAG